MAEVDDGELDALRKRAYGPRADIHLDPPALARLRELEARERVPLRVPATPAEVEPDLVATDPQPTALAVEPYGIQPDQFTGSGWRSEPVHETVDADAGPPEFARRALEAMRSFHPKRSTVMAVGALLVVAGIVVAALVLVQRVQTDPLQTGAEQIARLSTDPGYTIPAVFGGPTAGDQASAAPAGTEPTAPANEAKAFADFHGLRTIVLPTTTSSASSTKIFCLEVYPSENVVDATADSFSGSIFGGCEAGSFPAAGQFTLKNNNLPNDVVAAFPNVTALQFVYDREHDEVVVFAAR